MGKLGFVRSPSKAFLCLILLQSTMRETYATTAAFMAPFLKSDVIVTRHSNNAATDFFHSRRRLNTLYLNADDIIAQARAKTGINAETSEPAPPQLFDEDLRNDMQQVLLKLERRVKEGPGSLLAEELDYLEAGLRRIRDDMKTNQHLKPPRPQRNPTSTTETTLSATPQSFSNDNNDVTTAMGKLPTPATPLSSSSLSSAAADHNDEEGPAFDGRGGMGQPKGTVNTYVIPGMDEMSAEEFQAALQKSVSDRQAIRRKTGLVGNRSSQSYLDSLGG